MDVSLPADASAEEVAIAFTETDYTLPADRLDVLVISAAATADANWESWASEVVSEIRNRRSDGTLVLVPVMGTDSRTDISDTVADGFDLTVRIGSEQYEDLNRVLWALDTARGDLHRLPSVVDFNAWSVIPTSNVSEYDVVADLRARKFRPSVSGVESVRNEPVGAVVAAPEAYQSKVYDAFTDRDVLCVTSESKPKITVGEIG